MNTTLTSVPVKNHYPNRYVTKAGVSYIELTNNAGEGVAFALVDSDMLRPAIFSRRWRLHGKMRNYCYGSKYRKDDRKKGFHLGRLILDAKPGQRVLYKNGNPLDCRRENLVLKGTPKDDHRNHTA